MEKILIEKDEKLLEISMSVLNNARIVQSCMEDLYFNDVNLSGACINDANLTNLEINNAQMGGAYIHNIGMPPKGSPYHVEGLTQKPLRFEDCNLSGSAIRNCDLSGVRISDCNLEGMTIGGIPVTELLSAYKHNRS